MAEYGTKAMRLPKGEWLVYFDGTSQQLWEAIAPKANGSSAIVIKIDSYWGFASKNIWEWIEVVSK